MSDRNNENISETTMHHFACAWCDNEKCVKGTKECEFEQWKKEHESEEEDLAEQTTETETWDGIHTQITAPKGTFERIFINANDDGDI